MRELLKYMRQGQIVPGSMKAEKLWHKKMVNNNAWFVGLKKKNTELKHCSIIAHNSVEKWSELKHLKSTIE